MDKKTRARLESRAKIVKAMAHTTRLFIIEELAKKERCVCEFVDAVGADISTISKHLSVLKNAGIVEDEKRGLNVYYKLKVPCVLNIFSCAESVIKSSAKEQLKAV